MTLHGLQIFLFCIFVFSKTLGVSTTPPGPDTVDSIYLLVVHCALCGGIDSRPKARLVRGITAFCSRKRGERIIHSIQYCAVRYAGLRWRGHINVRFNAVGESAIPACMFCTPLNALHHRRPDKKHDVVVHFEKEEEQRSAD